MDKLSRPRNKTTTAKARGERQQPATRAEEALLADIAANMPVAIFRRMLKPDGSYVVHFASAGTYEIFGYDPAKTAPDDLLDAIHPDDRRKWEGQARESAANMAPFDFEMRVRTAAGETKWVRTVARPHVTADGETVWDGVDFDITMQKRTEAALRESEARFSSIVANLPGTVFRRVQHADGRIEYPYMSPTLLDFLGLEADAVMADPGPLMDSTHPDDRARMTNAYARSAEDLRPTDLVRRMTKSSGERIWVRTIARPIRTADGDTEWHGITLDVTAEHEATEAARERQETLNALAANIPGIIYQRVLHRDGRTTYPYVGEGVWRIYGHGVGEVTSDPALLLTTASPEEQASHDESLRRSAEDLSPWVWEGQIQTKDGALKWVETTGRPRRLESGETLWDCFLFDVTERKRTELARQESEVKYKELFDQSPVGIWNEDYSLVKRIIDELRAQGVRDFARHLTKNRDELRRIFEAIRPIDANRACVEIFRAPNNKALFGAVLDDFDMWAEHYIREVAALAAGETRIELEFDLKAFDGTEITVLFSTFIPTAHTDSWALVVTAMQDVTERKRVARALMDASSHFQAVLENMAQRLVALDQDLNIQFVNDRARQLLRHPPDILAPGVNFQRTVTLAAARGDYGPGDTATLAATRMETIRAGQGHASEQQLPGSEMIEVRETSLPLGGYVITYTDLTERRRAEAELRDSEARFRDIAEASAEWFWEMDRDLTFTFGSDRFFEITGWKPEEIYGQGRVRLVHPELEDLESEIWCQHFARMKRHEPFRNFEYAASRRDGSPFYLSLSGNPVFAADGAFLGYRGAGLDINERRHAVAELRKLSLAIQQSPVSIVIFDTEGIVEYVNPTFTSITGISHGDAMGNPSEVLWAMINAVDPHRGIWRNLEREDPARGEYVAENKSGKRFWFRESITRVRELGGEVTHYLSIGEDITTHKEMEIGLMQASKLTSLGEMAASLTHELNQPLNVIRTAADGTLILAEDGIEDPEFYKEQLEVISRQTTRMAEIIKHMRVYSRGDMTTATAFYPLPIVRGAVDMVANDMRLADIHVGLELPMASARVRGHPVRLEQVIVAVLNNARDAILATDSGPVGEEAQGFHGKIEVALEDRAEAGEVIIIVTDTGGGIPDDVIGRIFTSFFTTKPIGKGTGLGLSVAHNIIAEMEGSIEAGNTGAGARFRIALPTYQPEPEAAEGEANMNGSDPASMAASDRNSATRRDQ